MIIRKELKTKAKLTLKKHYIILVAACLIGSFLAAEYSSVISLDRNSATNVLDNILKGKIEEGTWLSQQITNQAVNESAASGNVFMGRSRGVLAMVVNFLTSGAIYVKIASAINAIFGTSSAAAILLIIGSLLLTAASWFLLENMYSAICCRIFLEGRIYESVNTQRFLFFLRVKKWIKVSWAMFVKSVFFMFWACTIVGGFIKYYSYKLVPYIVAENPEIGALTAISLSRRMMKGHKWECFKLHMSFFLWDILGIFTFGVVDLLYIKPYKQAVFAEYYVCLRQRAKDSKVTCAELLCDTYLFEQADAGLLMEKYADVEAILENSQTAPRERTGVRAFLANWLGIVLSNSEKERRYEDWEAAQFHIRDLKEALEGKCYPGRFSIVPESRKRSRLERVNCLRRYTIWSLIMMFFAFSFVGWVWEVSLHLISDGIFVNRGVLHGPWLPIYGGGSVLILTILYRLRKNAVLEFLGTVLLCGVVEYMTAWYLEIAHNGQKWWDYTGYFLNINGRVCAEGLFVFGVGGMFIVYVAAPMLEHLISGIKYKILIFACAVLCVAFATDQLYSSKNPNNGPGITSYESRRIDGLLKFPGGLQI